MSKTERKLKTEYSYAEIAGSDGAELLDKDGYHQPQNWSYRRRDCGCDLVTEKGAYRDESYELDDGTVVHYYHQSPVAVELPNGDVRVSSCGYQTTTTKQRLNRYTPRGYRVFQDDFEWFVSTPDDGTVPFRDGMVLQRI